jgi:hypothetical protein
MSIIGLIGGAKRPSGVEISMFEPVHGGPLPL